MREPRIQEDPKVVERDSNVRFGPYHRAGLDRGRQIVPIPGLLQGIHYAVALERTRNHEFDKAVFPVISSQQRQLLALKRPCKPLDLEHRPMKPFVHCGNLVDEVLERAQPLFEHAVKVERHVRHRRYVSPDPCDLLVEPATFLLVLEFLKCILKDLTLRGLILGELVEALAA